VARESIPRFDLYRELGVGPTANDQAVEAAYHALVEQHLGDAAGRATRSRLARLNLARDWLSDSERRSRYDASRTRAERAAMGATPSRRKPRTTAGTTSRKPTARRQKAVAVGTGAAPTAATGLTPAEIEAAAAATGLTAMEAAEAEATATAEAIAWAQIASEAAPAASAPTAPTKISWPTVDLARPATRVVPRRRSRRVPAAIGALVAVVAIVAIAAIAISMRPSTNVAVASPTVPPAPAETINFGTPSLQPEPTIAVTTPPASAVAFDTVALQQAAWDTIQALAAAAKVGDVVTAQTMLGDTAPGLRSSGLKRAVFPDVAAAALSVTQSGRSYTAIAGTDRLTSIDGVTWTFDYADRPLRAYTSSTGGTVYDLYWIEADGKHHLYLRVAVATVSTSGVTAKVVWSYDPSRPDDATYFQRAALVISSVTLDDTPAPVTATSLPMGGVTTLAPTATFTGVGFVPQRLAIGVTVSNPRSADGSDRAIESIFTLQGR
jgi:hypothetical protein